MARRAAPALSITRLPLRLVLMLLCALGFAVVPVAMMPVPSHAMPSHAMQAPADSGADHSAMPDCHTQLEQAAMDHGGGDHSDPAQPRSAMQQLICGLACAAVAPSVELAMVIPERLDAVPHAATMPALSGITSLPEARPPRGRA